ncbi:MAG TPA: copper resistance protein CopC [Cyclobacteriaceae bacterium]|nr:copper resistance protein CopC [Cyclobacteriaceae bacterium]
MKMLLISAMTLGISFFSFAKSTDATLMEVTSVRTSHKKVRITFKEPMEKVFISILDAEGDLVVKSKYKTKEPVTVPYDLSGLPAGDYQVKIETEEEIAVYDIETVEKKEIVKPLMAYGKFKDRNTITLLVVGLEKPGMSVDIYDQFNNKIKSEYIDQPAGFSKDYKFLNRRADKIYFHLKDAQGRSKYVYPKQQPKQ